MGQEFQSVSFLTQQGADGKKTDKSQHRGRENIRKHQQIFFCTLDSCYGVCVCGGGHLVNLNSVKFMMDFHDGGFGVAC